MLELKQGDRSAFEALMRKYDPRILIFIRLKIDATEYEDQNDILTPFSCPFSGSVLLCPVFWLSSVFLMLPPAS
jgi:hypothetical protein